MIYTAQISFDNTNYTAINSKITMKGEWVQSTMIWREKIKSLKINKADDWNTFVTLESWFTDTSKFETKIYIKILKNSVQESLHWFGIKWGEIDQDNTFYEVSPELQDLYSIWLQPYWNSTTELSYDFNVLMTLRNEDSTYYPKVMNLGVLEPFCELLEVFVKHKINEITAWPEADIVSSILFGSDYEDATAVTVTNALLIDYVTNAYNVFKYSVVAMDNETFRDFTLKKVFEMLTLFQIYAFFDSNDKLRLEHISFFKDKLENNAVSISLENYDNRFNYVISDIITREELEMMTSDEAKTYGLTVYSDWGKLPIVYSQVRNREDLQVKTYSFRDFYTNLDFYYKQYALFNSYCMIASGFANLAMDWVNIDMDTFTANNHYLTLVFNLVGRTCASKNIPSMASCSVTVVGVVVGEFTISIWDRSGNNLNSDTLTVTTSGTTSGTLTVITPSDDMFFKIDATVDGEFEGYIVATFAELYINPWNTGKKSTANAMNGDFSKANILDSYWKDGRASLSGTMNGTVQAFSSTAYNLQRKTIKQYFAAPPNPLYGMNDGTRIGKIKSWERDLDTGYIDLDLTYQED